MTWLARSHTLLCCGTLYCRAFCIRSSPIYILRLFSKLPRNQYSRTQVLSGANQCMLAYVTAVGADVHSIASDPALPQRLVIFPDINLCSIVGTRKQSTQKETSAAISPIRFRDFPRRTFIHSELLCGPHYPSSGPEPSPPRVPIRMPFLEDDNNMEKNVRDQWMPALRSSES